MMWDDVLKEIAIRHVCTLEELNEVLLRIETYPQSDDWKIAVIELYATLKDLGHGHNKLVVNLNLILDVLYAKRLMEDTVLQDMENMEVLEEIRLIRKD